MDVKEKILLVQLLLEDIRGNWGWERTGIFCSRVNKAKDLCEEIANELNDDNYFILSGVCGQYISYCEDGDNDGRFFREEFPKGYGNMYKLHGLDFTYKDKSNDFKVIAEKYLTYPEHRFNDWENRFDNEEETEFCNCRETNDKYEYWGYWKVCECGFNNIEEAEYCGGCGKKINMIGATDNYLKW